MKRKLALFLVLALVLSLVPANVFASSSNSISKTPGIDSDTVFTTSNAPVLRVEESNTGDFTSETFQLVLTNAEWHYTNTTAGRAAFSNLIEDYIEANDLDGTGATMCVADVNVLSSTKLEVGISIPATHTGDEYFLKIPMVTDFDEDGQATVAVKPLDSALSSGTFTFAVVGDSSTTTEIADTTDFGDATTTLEDITIEENSIGTFEGTAGNVITLKLTDTDFSWVTTGATVSLSGGFGSGTLALTVDSSDKNIVTFPAGALLSTTQRGTITISGLQVNPSNDASYGDVKVKVYDEKDEMTEETIVVGTYGDYAVTVTADDETADLPVLYAGDYSSDEDDMMLSEMVIEEVVPDSIDGDRSIVVQFPDWVHITEAPALNDTDNDNIGTIVDEGEFAAGDNSFEFSLLNKSTTSTGEIHLEFPVTIEAGNAGDIVATVSGRAISEEFKVTLGVAKAPITVTAEASDVKIGTQGQAAAKITIVEAADAVIGDNSDSGSAMTGYTSNSDVTGNELVLDLGDDFDFSGTPKVEVTKGDLEIDDVEKDGSVLTITIDQESTEASTIEITGVSVDVDRTVAEGGYTLSVGGGAIVKNWYDDEDEATTAGQDIFFEDSDTAAEVAYLNVVTPAPTDTTATAKVVFTIDAKDYKVGDTVVTGDATPFIDGNNRTMLPLRAMATALGVTDANISWNETERSVTIFKGDRVIKVVIGQSSFLLNGTPVPMDTVAVIKDSRTFLPVRALGQAMGKVVTWDEATRTVTLQ